MDSFVEKGDEKNEIKEGRPDKEYRNMDMDMDMESWWT